MEDILLSGAVQKDKLRLFYLVTFIYLLCFSTRYPFYIEKIQCVLNDNLMIKFTVFAWKKFEVVLLSLKIKNNVQDEKKFNYYYFFILKFGGWEIKTYSIVIKKWLYY